MILKVILTETYFDGYENENSSSILFCIFDIQPVSLVEIHTTNKSHVTSSDLSGQL